jgi:hypothetical protein
VDSSKAKGLILMLIGLPPQTLTLKQILHHHTDKFSESLP